MKYFKTIIVSLLLLSGFSEAQQQNYKTLLDSFYQNSETGFKDIIGKQTDTESSFYPSILNADIGEVKIGKFPNAVTLNWIIPLAKSEKVQQAVQDFMKNTYSDEKMFKTISDGTEEEGEKYTNVYILGGEKPLLIFQTIYYKNEDNPEKSNFTVMMYGK